jgi:hypothetical protein
MFSRSIQRCNTIGIVGGYPAAERYFRNTKLPRSKYWSDNERPLYNVRCQHYRLEQHMGGDYYDVMLYRTPMLRLFRPEADGTRELHLRAHGSSASSLFMWYVCGFSYAPSFTTQDGATVRVPLICSPAYGSSAVGDVPESFSAKIVLDPQGRLIRERSAHYTTYSAVMSEHDKALRAEMLDRLAPFIDLLMLRREYFHAAYKTPMSNGKPFKRARYSDWVGLNTFKGWMDVGDNEFKAMEQLAQLVYNQVYASKVWVDASDDAPLTVSTLRSNYTRVILELMGLDTQSGKRMHGAFPTKLPQKYSFA